ncbi:ABC transporter permease [Latilactobacillus curvatus]|uniref:ABC transporter permease n=1 Tax=Latilactobacillus curvatus TaxID=28038 RepID=UPI0020C7872A|nr:ABC transporter permease [Latilactobacillus curvatus]MCP8863093.1 ABC transporter permease [Latilactobacillus curvatus]
MQTRLYLQTTFRDIRQAIGRFIAIILIILMGVLLFVGIKSIGPNLEETVDHFVTMQRVSDLQISGTAGLTEQDRAVVEKMHGVQAELGYRIPYRDEARDVNLQLYNYQPTARQNRLTLTTGRYPQRTNEILVDNAVKTHYRLGQRVTVKSQQLLTHRFKVVGYVDSPLYIDRQERGTVPVGDGQLDGFMYLPQKAFAPQPYSVMMVRFSDLDRHSSFLQAYRTGIATKETQLMRQLKAHTTQPQQQYLLTARSANPGFNEFTSLSDRIDAIGNVFPVFFFLIGILITFTTITRMIEENRKEIGTLKALGYRNWEIAQKYLLYALLTGSIGTVLGTILGTKLLPLVVYRIQKPVYTFAHYPTHFWTVPILLATGAVLIATVGATGYVLIRDLREKPTQLLRPKAPKPGQRIWLERITPLWRRLSFHQKVTYRNLFRYKARMILTILGIAGCTGLMVAGFGLKTSIGEVADRQFKQLTHYQAIVTLKIPNSTAQTKSILTQTEKVRSYLPVTMTQAKFKQKGITDQAATVCAVADQAKLAQYVALQTPREQQRLTLPKHGAIIAANLAKTYAVQKGDWLTLQTAQGKRARIQVAGISENYLGNSVYLRQSALSKTLQQPVAANAYLVRTAKMTTKQEKQLATRLQQTTEVAATTFISDQGAKQATASANLDPIVFIFIGLSAVLAFVVLFNLTSINVSERERELATIKVLGFFDKEVTAYIVRENVIFTVVGIVLGFGIGKLLTWFIITMASSEQVAFPLIIPASGYLIAAGMTVLFSLIVMGMTHRKLKGIDMIGALKENE